MGWQIKRWSWLLSLAVVCGSLGSSAQSAKLQHTHISLIASSTDSSGSQWIGLRFQLDPGWHIYWSNPGDSGEPPKVMWHLPSGVQAGELQFPAPHRIADHGLTDYGYEGEAILLAKITVPAGATSNKPEIAADVRYLVCREVCIPGKDRLSMNLGMAQSADNTALIQATQARLPGSLRTGIHARAAVDASAIVVAISGQNSKMGQITDFIPSDPQVIDNSVKPDIAKSGAITYIRLKQSEQLDHPPSELHGLLLTQDRAYNLSVPVAPARKSSQKSSAPKHG